MANKFKKAVELRNSEVEVKEEINNNNTTEIVSEIDSSIKLDLADILNKKEIKSKNKTFYLETNVIRAVEIHAKKQKVSDSKLVNDILKHIFNIKD